QNLICVVICARRKSILYKSSQFPSEHQFLRQRRMDNVLSSDILSRYIVLPLQKSTRLFPNDTLVRMKGTLRYCDLLSTSQLLLFGGEVFYETYLQLLYDHSSQFQHGIDSLS